MGRFSVNVDAEDDLIRSFAKNARVGSNGPHIETPIRVGTKDVRETPVCEVYKEISSNKIDLCLNDSQIEREYNATIRARLNCNDGVMNAFFLSYDDQRKPAKKQMTFLADLQNVHSDILITPSWTKYLNTIPGEEKTKQYLSLTEEFLDYSPPSGYKPYMGNIPTLIPNNDIEKVIKFYVERGITSFVIDSDGRVPWIDTWILNFYRTIGDKQYNIENECLIYSINASTGRAKKNEMTYEAKDFIGFGAGFDIIGEKHVNKSFPHTQPTANFNKRFNPGTYHYEKIPDTVSSRAEIKSENVRTQIIEMGRVREILTDHDPLTKFLETKTISEKTIKSLINIKKDIRMVQSPLDRWFS